ncbi:MAG: DNA mismatch repair protein MutS, partial [Gemmatimonadales bacterium]
MAAADTPLMQQWREAKRRHPDALIFFRVGDFYELFHDDAREASRLLGLTLTSRNNGAAAEVAMAGVPARALDDYLAKVVRSGRRAAICDQVEDAAEAKGIVRREVVETVTPGTVLHDSLLTADRNNFLVAVAPPASGDDAPAGLAALDLSTGELLLQLVPLPALEPELGRMEPAELLLPESLRQRLGHGPIPATVRDDWLFDEESGRDELARMYRVRTLDGLGLQPGDGPLVRAAGALLQYVAELQPAGFDHLQPPRILRPGAEMVLDEMTRRNLELVEPLRTGEEGGTLVDVLDETVTAMGGRLLRRWILRPLVEPDPIWRRQAAVEELVEDPELRGGLRDLLDQVHDLERLAAKVASGRISPRELLALGRSLALLPRLRELADERGVGSDLLRELALELDPMEDVASLVAGAIADDAPATLQEGGVIREGHSDELDDLRRTRDGARDFIAGLQVRERERTG